jgi:hypothetical protein
MGAYRRATKNAAERPIFLFSGILRSHMTRCGRISINPSDTVFKTAVEMRIAALSKQCPLIVGSEFFASGLQAKIKRKVQVT